MERGGLISLVYSTIALKRISRTKGNNIQCLCIYIYICSGRYKNTPSHFSGRKFGFKFIRIQQEIGYGAAGKSWKYRKIGRFLLLYDLYFVNICFGNVQDNQYSYCTKSTHTQKKNEVVL